MLCEGVEVCVMELCEGVMWECEAVRCEGVGIDDVRGGGGALDCV